MATKDWKKFGEGKWEKDDYEIWVYKGKVDGKIKWIVRFKEIGGDSYTRSFKSRPQAIAFANKYMRTH